MALENYRITEFQEKTQVDNGDYVLIDSATDGTHKYQLSRIPAQASAEVAAAVAAEKTAREAADAAEVTARNAAIGAAISDEVTARNAAIAANVDNTLTISGKAADAKKTGDEITSIKSDLTDLQDEVDDLIGGEEQQEITGWTHEKYINVATPNIGDTVDITNVSSYWSLKYVIVDCEEGDKFLLNLSGAASARAWAFLTSGNVLISRADANVTLTDVTITAPQNARKAIFQCMYRPTQDDTTTDNGTAYKIVGGSGNVVRFDIVQDKTEEEKARARQNIGITGSGGGLSDEAKAALLNCFAHVAWIDEYGQTYYNALSDALDSGESYPKIIASYDGNALIGEPINNLKNHLVVKYYENESDTGTVVASANYTLTGSLSNKINVVRINYEDIQCSLSVAVDDTRYEYCKNLHMSVGAMGGPYTYNNVTYCGTDENTRRKHLYTEIVNEALKILLTSGGTPVRLLDEYIIQVPENKSSATIEMTGTSLMFAVRTWEKLSSGINIVSDSGWVNSPTTITLTENIVGISVNIKNTSEVANPTVNTVVVQFQ